MGARLQESYADLEKKVESRTAELKEALQQQTATSEVLKVISRSAFDLDSVMNTLTRSAQELCGATSGGLFLRDGDRLICRGVAAVDETVREMMLRTPVLLDMESHMGRSVLTGTVVNIPDFESSNTN